MLFRSIAPELPIALIRGELDPDPVAIAAQLHLTSYNVGYKSLLQRPSAVADLHRAGVAVMVWTSDSPADWQQLDKIGVDGIITNKPSELQGWVAAWLQKPKLLDQQVPPPAEGGLTPFIFVQLAADYPGPTVADQRIAQALALSLPNVGMASAIDLGLPSGDSEASSIFKLFFLLLFFFVRIKADFINQFILPTSKTLLLASQPLHFELFMDIKAFIKDPNLPQSPSPHNHLMP